MITTSRSRKRIGFWLALVSLFLFAPFAPAQEAERGGDPTVRSAPWDEEILDLFAKLPVQHGGRVKPFDSFAGLKLLTFNGKRRLKLEDGEKLTALPWLLDCLYYPEQARGYPCFRIQSDAVLTSIGLRAKGKRAWYSYDELLPARNEIHTQASGYRSIPAGRRNPLQRQTLKLAGDLLSFEDLIGSFEPVRRRYSTGASPALAEVFGPEPEQGLSALLEQGTELRRVVMGSAEIDAEERQAIEKFSSQFSAAMFAGERGVTFLPPPDEATDPTEWWSLSAAAVRALEGDSGVDAVLPWITSLERLEANKGNTEVFREELTSLAGAIGARAEARGEYGHIGLEVAMNRADPFYASLLIFLIAFLLTVFSWVAPRSKLLFRSLWGAVGIATLLVVFGITMRCVIRGRPPVVSLYDTILFVTATGALFWMVLEAFTRVRVALSLASVFGVVGMFLAARYELREVESAGDTMASVIAVLDTNHYLAVHVTTITLGYMAGLVASLAAHVWILGKLFGFRRGDESFYRILTALTYGAICFSLLFSIFGTIYGGKWANDSWGRFWGWDPKENGALLICLWELLILHARFGGYIRDRGLAVMAVLGAIVVTASWWGVNLLNVGLHSYGFTSGIAMTLFILWGIELLVVALAGVDALRHPASSDRPPEKDSWPEKTAEGADV